MRPRGDTRECGGAAAARAARGNGREVAGPTEVTTTGLLSGAPEEAGSPQGWIEGRVISLHAKADGKAVLFHSHGGKH